MAVGNNGVTRLQSVNPGCAVCNHEPFGRLQKMMGFAYGLFNGIFKSRPVKGRKPGVKLIMNMYIFALCVAGLIRQPVVKSHLNELVNTYRIVNRSERIDAGVEFMIDQLVPDCFGKAGANSKYGVLQINFFRQGCWSQFGAEHVPKLQK